MMNLLAGAMDHVASHSLRETLQHAFGPEKFTWVPAWMTTHHFLTTLVAVVAIGLLLIASRSIAVPQNGSVEDHLTKGRFSQFIEVLCEFIREKVVRPALGDQLTDKYIGYIWTVFFFALTANLLGLIPLGAFFALLNPELEHLGGTATANFMVTGALATFSFLAIVCIGVKEGGKHFFAHFSPVPLWPIMKNGNVLMLPLALFLVVLEIVGLLIKCVVLAVRLFGNIAAGHLVMAAVLGLITAGSAVAFSMKQLPVGVTVIAGLTALSLLELFVAFLQAYIFTFLTVLFLASGAAHHGDEHH